MSDRPDLKVVPLPPPTDATPDLIAVLEAALERAKDGDLESFLMVAVMRGGGSLSARHAPAECSRYALIGATEHEVFTLHRMIDDDSRRNFLWTPDEPA